MTNNAPLKNISPDFDRPHDTTKKSIERRQHRAPKPNETQKLRILCHYLSMLVELQNEKAANGHA